MDWLAHYRKTKYGWWLLYVGGEVVADHIQSPAKDANVRFPDHRLVWDGKVNLDVRA